MTADYSDEEIEAAAKAKFERDAELGANLFRLLEGQCRMVVRWRNSLGHWVEFAITEDDVYSVVRQFREALKGE